MTKKIDLLVVGGLLVFDRIAVLERLPPLGGTVLFPGLNKELEEKYFGGCTVNVAAAASVLGLRVGLVGFTGNDFESSGYRKHLDRIGIKDRWLPVVEGQDIAHCYSFYDPDGTKLSFMDWLGPTHPRELNVPDDVIENSKQVVIIGGSRDDPVSDSLLEIAMIARKAQVPVILAWAGGITNIETKYFELIDVLLCNHFEIELILQHFGLEGERSIFSLGPKIVFVTSGGEGSNIYSDGNKVNVPVVEAPQVLDPTGAGDSYAGGVLTGISWGKTPEICGRIGSIVSSFVVEKKGCQTNLPSRKLLEQRYKATFGEALNEISGEG